MANALVWLGIVLSLALQAPVADKPTPAAQPATREAGNPLLEKHADAALAIKESATLPVIAADSIGKVVQFQIEADMLSAATPLQTNSTLCRVQVPDLAGVLTLQMTNLTVKIDSPAPGKSAAFFFKQHDFSQSGSWVYITTVQALGGQLLIAREGEDGQTQISSVQLIQSGAPQPGVQMSEDPVRLIVRMTNLATGENAVDFQITAPSFVELRRKHPKEVDQYLRPVIRDFKQESIVFGVDDKVAWQVLGGQWQPDAQTKSRVTAAVAKFDSDSFQERESAQKALESIGQPAANVLMSMDRGKLSPEAISGIDTFLAQYSPLKSADAERLGNDPRFLLDALYSENVDLRSVAAKQFARIVGRSVDFDPQAAADTRAAQISALRLQLESPSTKPSR